MNYFPEIADWLKLITPSVLVATSLVVLLGLCHRFIIVRYAELGNEKMLTRQLLMLFFSIVSVIIFVLSLPVSDGTRNQLLVLIGIIISGLFAFSSTTIFTNLMAGMMLRVTRPFLTGDFIRVDGFFGRVTERGLLDTEIQTEDKQLVALPNFLLINSPISVVRKSGTVVSVTLSLGYDVHHEKIEKVLLEAIEKADLEEGFVHVLELGDDAITYKASGILVDVMTYLTAHSNLRKQILDCLHNNRIEIVSPSFVNQRVLDTEQVIIPSRHNTLSTNNDNVSAETVIFDKANLATELEESKKVLKIKIKEYEERMNVSSSQEKIRLKALIKETLDELNSLRSVSLEDGENDTA